MSQHQQNQSLSTEQRVISILLIAAGVGVIGLTLTANLVGLSQQPGFGSNKIGGILVGFVLLLGGVGLTRPVSWRYVNQILKQVTAQPTLRLRSLDPFFLALWFGLLTGLGEVVVWIILKFLFRLLNPTIITSSNIIWMAPLTNLVFFAILGLVLVIIFWRWPSIASLPIAVFSLAFLSFFNLLLMIPGLHRYAIVLLATGLAIQTARFVAGQPARFGKIARYMTGSWSIFNKRNPFDSLEAQADSVPENYLPSRRQFLLSSGAVIAGLAVGTQGLEKLIEWQTLSKLPLASPKAPNVLLIVLDTVRAQNLSLYGYNRPTTPHLAHWAEQGVRFERAISTAPWTLPSHGSIFTGRWHHQLSTNWTTPLDRTYPTLAEVLSKNGYLTAGFVANLDFCSAPYGLNRGFAHYEDFPISPGQTILSSVLGREVTNNNRFRRLIDYYDVLNRKHASQLTSDFLTWLPRQGQRPFFAFLNYYDAHQPYFPPAPFDTKFGPKNPREDFAYFTNDAERANMWELSPAEIQSELDAYDGAIAYMDYNLDLLMNELTKQGILDNTLVIITADHGEQFGEHRLFGHTNSLYIQTLHVPLLVRYPARVPTGLSIAEPVTLRDLPSTIMDLIELKDSDQFSGVSLAQHWEQSVKPKEAALGSLLSEINGGGFSWQDWYPVVKGDMKSLILGNYHYIKNGDGREELYDWANDPTEEHDLIVSEEGRRVIAQCRMFLAKMLAG